MLNSLSCSVTSKNEDEDKGRFINYLWGGGRRHSHILVPTPGLQKKLHTLSFEMLFTFHPLPLSV